MAGPDGTFSAAAFRSGIRFAMNLGAPPVSGDQAVFVFKRTLVYNRNVDGENVPFDPESTVTEIPETRVKVACAIEYQDKEGIALPFGTVTASKVLVTLLDEEYDQIKGSNFIVVGGERYNYSRTVPPLGLFSVGVWSILFTAENEI